MENQWNYWINEPIFCDEGVSSIAKRKHCLAQFCFEGILPLLRRKGYILRFSEKELTKQLLYLLFALEHGKQPKPRISHEGAPHREEQYDHFQYKITTSEWLEFWETWGSLQDFQESHCGYPLRFELSEYIWSWIDLDHSPTAIQLEQWLLDEEAQEEMSKGKEDPYLQETSKRDYLDRHWF